MLTASKYLIGRLFFMLVLLSVAGCSGKAQSAALSTPTFTPLEAQGRRVFEQHCSTCHSTIPDSIIVGPSLAGVGKRAVDGIEGMIGREYIEMSIEQPGMFLVEGYADLMPATLAETLSEEEIDAIIAYLMTLNE